MHGVLSLAYQFPLFHEIRRRKETPQQTSYAIPQSKQLEQGTSQLLLSKRWMGNTHLEGSTTARTCQHYVAAIGKHTLLSCCSTR